MLAGYGATLLASFCVTYLLTPLVKKAALRFGAMDQPGVRKIHQAPVPRWGGLSLFLGIACGAVLAYFFSSSFRESVRGAYRDDVLGIAGACFLMLLVGMADDVRPMSARWKLFWQVLASGWLLYQGVRVTFVTNPFSGQILFLRWPLGLFISLLWMVGITNALNLLDGLDGLLAGISTISALALFGVALEKGYVFPAFILMAMSGSTLAFLRYNFNPAQIFLGDAGSLFLGMLWASLSIAGALKTPTVAVFVPLLVLGLPIADTIFALFRRFGKGRSIFEADKEHLHHRLLKRGWSQKKAVLVLYLMGGILGTLAIFVNRWFRWP